jgi:hypothetical protein
MKVGRTLGFVAAMALAGCGGPKLYPVEGTVMWTDGKPARELAGGRVSFEPLEGKHSADGPIDAEARYVVGTLRPGDGVPPGRYRVTLAPPLSADPDKPTPSLLDPDYQRLDLTKLEVTVDAKRNDIPLKLERRGKKQ